MRMALHAIFLAAHQAWIRVPFAQTTRPHLDARVTSPRLHAPVTRGALR
jgi:hypothetical protein